MPGGAHHDHVAQSLIEDDLGRDPGVGAAKHHGVGSLRGGQAGPVLDALAGMLRLAGDESLVTLLECPPGGYRSRVGHGAYCAPGLAKCDDD